jgi:hypothetical protein
MKYLLILLTIVMFGCSGQREKELSDLNFKRSIELLQTQEKLDAYKEPENVVKPFVIRDYKVEDGSPLRIVSPKDCFLGTELEFKFKDIKTLIVCDNTYWLPSREYVLNKLLPTFRHVNKMVYTEKFDCDDFSKQLSFWSQLFYIKTVFNKSMESIAISEIHYLKKSRAGSIKLKLPVEVDIPIPIYVFEKHAINAFVLDDLTVIFIEPQTGQQEILSEEEIKSIYFCRF